MGSELVRRPKFSGRPISYVRPSRRLPDLDNEHRRSRREQSVSSTSDYGLRKQPLYLYPGALQDRNARVFLLLLLLKIPANKRVQS